MAVTLQLVESIFAGLIHPTTGALLASCNARFYDLGTLTPQTVYSDSAAATPITQPLVLTAAGQGVVYTANPCRCIIKSADDLTTIYDVAVINGSIPASTFITSAAFNGGTQTTLQAILDAVDDALGGSTGFWNYKQASGATERTVKSWMSEVSVLATDYGAVGDDATDNLTFLNNAKTAAVAAGASVLKIPAGTYRISGEWDLAATIKIIGDGRGRTILKFTGTSTTYMVKVSGNDVYLGYLTVQSSVAGTGVRIEGTRFIGEQIGTTLTNTGTVVGFGSSAGATVATLLECSTAITGTAGTSGAGYSLGGQSTLIGCSATGTGIYGFTSNAGKHTLIGFNSTATVTTGISGNSGSDGISIIGGSVTNATNEYALSPAQSGPYYDTGSIDYLKLDQTALTATAADLEPTFGRVGRVGYSFSVANGGTFSIAWDKCQTWCLTGLGATATVNITSSSATNPPATKANVIGIRLLLKNAAGGTTWTLGALFKPSPAPSAVASHVTGYYFLWDGAAWRSLGDTA